MLFKCDHFIDISAVKAVEIVLISIGRQLRIPSFIRRHKHGTARGNQSAEWRDEAQKLADQWKAHLAANDAEADAALKAKFPEGSER